MRSLRIVIVCLVTKGALRFSAYGFGCTPFSFTGGQRGGDREQSVLCELPALRGRFASASPFRSRAPYEIVQTITFGKMDYNNFWADMEADRQFIEDYSELCGTGVVWKCLFVRQRGKLCGILIVPTDECYVKYAAHVAEQKIL